MARCPICQAEAKPRAENPMFPFCSARCRTIDLGKWMNEEYRIGVQPSAEDLDDLGVPEVRDEEADEEGEEERAGERDDDDDDDDSGDGGAKRKPDEAEPVRH